MAAQRAPVTVRRLACGLAWLALVAPALSEDPRDSQLRRDTQPDRALASVMGQVVDCVTARPVPNAAVFVYGVPVFDVSPDPAAGGSTMPIWAAPSCSTRSDSEGRFTCDGLDPWAYTVQVRKDWASGEFGQRSPSSDGRVLTLTAGQPPQTIRVPLWRDPIVSGRVLDPRGEPLIGMNVVAIPAADLTSRSFPGDRQSWLSSRG